MRIELRQTHLQLATLLVIGTPACGSRTGLFESAPDAGSDAALQCETGAGTLLADKRSRFLFLVDASGSMKGDPWSLATAAATVFFADPRSSDLEVGLSFLPALQDDCNAESYESPTVPIATLFAAGPLEDKHEADLVLAFSSHQPTGSTTVAPAIEGSHRYLAKLPDTGKRRELVLVTDATGGGCVANELALAATLAKDALHGPGSIVTHAIHVGDAADFSKLAPIAAAGGGKAIHLGSKQLDVALFDALIDTTRSCTFTLSPNAGTALSLTKANGSPVEQLVRVDSSSACSGKANEWHPHPSDANAIVLCQSTCERRSDEGLSLVATCDEI